MSWLLRPRSWVWATKISCFTVVFDACVLYPAPLRDLLMLELLWAQSIGRHQLKGKKVLNLQGCRDRLGGTRSPHEHRQVLRRLPVLTKPPLRHSPTQQGGGRLNLDLAGAPARLVRPDPSQGLQQLLGVLRRDRHIHGTEHVVHVVPADPS